MNLSIRTNIFAFFLVLNLLGCTYFKPSDLPEDVYVVPQHGYYHPRQVGIFQFAGPSNAPGTGKAAAHYLYVELLKQNMFSSITFESNVIIDRKNIINTINTKKYDLIIIGNLLHYFDGGYFHTSQVEEDITAIRRIGNNTQILLYARALEAGSPVPSADYLIFNRKGSPAPSASTLMQKNAIKFCNLFIEAFSR